MRKRSLRSRLTLLVAAAVAIAVAVSAVGCWYFVRRELSWQLNQSLRDIAVPVKAMQGAVRNCSSEPSGRARRAPGVHRADADRLPRRRALRHGQHRDQGHPPREADRGRATTASGSSTTAAPTTAPRCASTSGTWTRTPRSSSAGRWRRSTTPCAG
ncbi:hypothetical protein ACFSTC_17200 [Nonomuraea ferruginea]